MVEPFEARIGENGLLDIVEGCLCWSGPVGCDEFGVFKISGESAERSNSKFKMWYEFAVELSEPDKFGYVTDRVRLRPMLEKLML
jgi:hypothetical protein